MADNAIDKTSRTAHNFLFLFFIRSSSYRLQKFIVSYIISRNNYHFLFDFAEKLVNIAHIYYTFKTHAGDDDYDSGIFEYNRF